MSLAGIVATSIALFLAGVRSARAAGTDACDLLTDTDIRAVQGQAVAERAGSEQATASFRISQCYYRTTEVVRSVSLALTRPLAGNGAHSNGPVDYWRNRFHGASDEGDAAVAAERRKPAPAAVSGLGDEAYWAGDPVSGALYVLSADTIVRISVGGARSETERLERSRALAAKVVSRLPSRTSSPSSRTMRR